MDPVSSSFTTIAQNAIQRGMRPAALNQALESAAADAFRETLQNGVRGDVSPLTDGFYTESPRRTHGGEAFGSVLKDFIHEVDAKGKEAEAMRTALLTGESNNIHQTMIALQESNVAFTLMVEVRNKVLETYQELMRMQV